MAINLDTEESVLRNLGQRALRGHGDIQGLSIDYDKKRLLFDSKHKDSEFVNLAIQVIKGIKSLSDKGQLLYFAGNPSPNATRKNSKDEILGFIDRDLVLLNRWKNEKQVVENSVGPAALLKIKGNWVSHKDLEDRIKELSAAVDEFRKKAAEDKTKAA